ncbi:helix-turn-helix transcriptional regulator [Marinitenerispora sediminis]|uniref:Transcriptional regulator n=1 Tax=Marinitenerispora sediminis TaxID=1931232 RepID=A0A368T867_9ACTN|nr:transcriptional regulator [Marinitenerispora sediminis]RCV57287.1 transcriptional regulator [Marinitenerispora sediminis]RCV58253.1 transcriptional regulator [Marinitenerispora sediminis]RCV58473.1 transcriptional regulator [Marinitenerispora sediminis]
MTEAEIDALGLLTDPLRRALYRYVAGQDHEVSRAEAAEAVGAQRNLAAFHLDKLVAARLLDVRQQRISGRTGPGSGRPAKLYRRSTRQHTVQLPPRDYETAAHVLAEAVERHGADAALYAAAREEGERRGAALAARAPDADIATLRSYLGECGYEPVPDEGAGSGQEAAGPPDRVRLRNCPFHTLAAAFPPLTCGMNLELLRGLLAGAGCSGLSARLAPESGRCCVEISKTNEN